MNTVRDRFNLAKLLTGVQYDVMSSETGIKVMRLQTILSTDTGIKADELELIYTFFEKHTTYSIWIKTGQPCLIKGEECPIEMVESLIVNIENGTNITRPNKLMKWSKRDIPRLRKAISIFK
jgi:hypothetical protein